MAGRQVSMVRRRFMMSGLVVLGRFFVVTRRCMNIASGSEDSLRRDFASIRVDLLALERILEGLLSKYRSGKASDTLAKSRAERAEVDNLIAMIDDCKVMSLAVARRMRACFSRTVEAQWEFAAVR